MVSKHNTDATFNNLRIPNVNFIVCMMFSYDDYATIKCLYTFIHLHIYEGSRNETCIDLHVFACVSVCCTMRLESGMKTCMPE